MPVGAVGVGQGPLDGVDGAPGGLGGQVAVDVRGRGECGVPQRLGDDGEGDAGVDGEGGGQVPQVVQGDAWDAGFLGELTEAVEDVFGAQRAAVRAAENQADVGIVRVAVYGIASAGPGSYGAACECCSDAGGIATQFLLLRVLGEVSTRRLLSIAERVQRT